MLLHTYRLRQVLPPLKNNVSQSFCFKLRSSPFTLTESGSRPAHDRRQRSSDTTGTDGLVCSQSHGVSSLTSLNIILIDRFPVIRIEPVVFVRKGKEKKNPLWAVHVPGHIDVSDLHGQPPEQLIIVMSKASGFDAFV
ncbi:hypothetical protein EVAR_82321_1 [Eumeta japonica]|uniref:Uncharacterized protein n=1 Tax=Eumeta variegata TaxID=151549 RepID=A0A4C1UA18_EUMVA|nr:hypothetical protein EVAR_82321_1 [Eumeta japonica]